MKNGYFSKFLMFIVLTIAGAFQPKPSSAQKFLAFDKIECRGLVTLDTSRIAVGAFSARTFDVPNPRIKLLCDGQPIKIVECPGTTKRVTVDRTQSDRYASIVCLSR